MTAPQADRCPIRVPLIVYITVAPLLYYIIVGYFSAFAIFLTDEGVKFLNAKLLLSGSFHWQALVFIVSMAISPEIFIVIVPSFLFGLFHHYFYKNIQNCFVPLVMFGVGFLVVAVISCVSIIPSQSPVFQSISIGQRIVVAVVMGLVGAFISLACALVTLLITRWFQRRFREGLVKDVF